MAPVTEHVLENQASRPLIDLQPRYDERCANGRAFGRALGLDGAVWQTDALPLMAGTSANFPYGEIFTLPTSAESVVVVDLTIPYVSSGMLNEPVAIGFVAGRVSAIDGGAEAAELERLLSEAGGDAAGVAEVGLGMNPELTPCGHVLIDEKAAGTAHIAIGGNTDIGGTRTAPIHIDCVFTLTSLSSAGTPIELA